MAPRRAVWLRADPGRTPECLTDGGMRGKEQGLERVREAVDHHWLLPVTVQQPWCKMKFCRVDVDAAEQERLVMRVKTECRP